MNTDTEWVDRFNSVLKIINWIKCILINNNILETCWCIFCSKDLEWNKENNLPSCSIKSLVWFEFLLL